MQILVTIDWETLLRKRGWYRTKDVFKKTFYFGEFLKVQVPLSLYISSKEEIQLNRLEELEVINKRIQNMLKQLNEIEEDVESNMRLSTLVEEEED